MSSKKQSTRPVSSSENNLNALKAAKILGLGPQELDDFLFLELESSKRIAPAGLTPPDFPEFKNAIINRILLRSEDEKWVNMTRQLLHRSTERRFYFSKEEVEAVSRILVAIETSPRELDLTELGLRALPPLVKELSIPVLYIAGNKISDLQPVAGLNLLELHAPNNEIHNLEPIKGMQSLQMLNLGNNQVAYLEPLHHLKGLKYLDLPNNSIDNIESLITLLQNPSLNYINLIGNPLDLRESILDNINHLREYFGISVKAPTSQPARKASSKASPKRSSKAPETTSEALEEDIEEPLEENKVPPPEPTPAGDTPPENSFRSFATGRVWITGAPEENLLDVEDVSKILYESIANTEEQVEQFFGLFGRWGRGKTHLWNYLKKEFIDKQKNTAEEKYIPVEFHAWKYQDTPGLWAYLYCELNKAYFDEKPKKFKWLQKLARVMRLNYVRGKILKPALLLAGGLCFAVAVYLFFETRIDFLKETSVQVLALTGTGVISLYSLIKYVDDRYRSNMRRLLTQMTGNVNLTSHLGLQHEIQEELKFLLKAWLPHNEKNKDKPRKRIFLFIDDIDRCSEDKIIQIVDYIRVLLHDTEVQSRITVLAAIDERILIHAIQNKYRRFIENKDNDATYIELCREYMDKLFLAGIKLGPLTSFEKEQVVSGFTRQYLMKEPVLPKEKESPAEDETSTSQAELRVSFRTPKTELGGSSRRSIASELGGQLAGNIDPLFHELGDKLTGNGQEQPKKPEPEQGTEQEYSLEPWEQKFLRKIVANTDLTPRGIRVFTHRYLLGKKLVEKALTNGKPSWEHWYYSAEAKECFALKLLHYSFRAGVPELYNDYNNYIKNYDENNTVTETVYNLRVSLNQELGSVMYQVLTMIVAY